MTIAWTDAATWAARPTVWSAAVGFLAFAAVLWPIEKLWPARRGQPIRRRGFVTDLIFWAFSPLVGKVAAYAVVTAIVAALMSLGGRELDLTSTTGWGPVGRLPLWAQAVGAFVVADFAALLGKGAPGQCILVLIGATPEGRKELVGFTDGAR